VLVNPNRPYVADQSDLQAAAAAMGRQLVFQNAGTERDIDVAFGMLAWQRVNAVLVTADPFFHSKLQHLVNLAARHALPAIYQWRKFAQAGGLMSYGPMIGEAYNNAGRYAGLILKGTRPADLPVVQPTKFELVINLKTAKTLDLGIPRSLLDSADTVIE
jgi:putative tryptophan/tyrosine transport system substrate-binding protein